jgi:AbrB family looped-hinge helix DNA binding protein
MSSPDDDREVLASSVVTRNNQVTIPVRVRERFGFKEGDLVLFVLVGKDRVQIEKG